MISQTKVRRGFVAGKTDALAACLIIYVVAYHDTTTSRSICTGEDSRIQENSGSVKDKLEKHGQESSTKIGAYLRKG